MQAAINRRVQSRINILRQASVGVLVPEAGEPEVARVLKQELRFANQFAKDAKPLAVA